MGSDARHGVFVISLDFELYWGVRDRRVLADYAANLLGVRAAIPQMLRLFTRFDVQATWAVVGFLFCADRDELLRSIPDVQPEYVNHRLSPYPYLREVGEEESDDPYHYGASLIRLIAATAGQEIGTHTLSHYYCLEEGESIAAFSSDLTVARALAQRAGIKVESLVFPRNQYDDAHLAAAAENGIRVFRGNEGAWMYAPVSKQRHDSKLRKAARLLDAYLPIGGHHTYEVSWDDRTRPCNVPSSRFLRPYSHRLRALEWLRLRRIRSAMTHAARSGRVFHLWWHPENFGLNLPQNLRMLERILEHYSMLRDRYGMESSSMGAVAREVALHDSAATSRPSAGMRA